MYIPKLFPRISVCQRQARPELTYSRAYVGSDYEWTLSRQFRRLTKWRTPHKEFGDRLLGTS